MLSRFCICFFVNVLLQTPIMMLYYQVMMGGSSYVLTVPQILKNLLMFPIESVVLTLFLKILLPVTQRAKISYNRDSDMRFTKKQVIILVCLTLVGALTATGYLAYRYNTSSRSADYSKTERVEIQKSMTELVLDETDDWDDQTVICIVDSAYRGLFEQETDYTVAVYVLDQEAFAAGQAADNTYTIDTLWGYSKSGPKKDPYGSLIKVATAEVQKNEKTGGILSITIAPLQ
jgi:hypothetical protein